MNRKFAFAVLLILFRVLTLASWAQGTFNGTFVVPRDYAQVEGDRRFSGPFCYTDDTSGSRVLSVFGPASTPSFPSGGVFLTGIKFRLDSSVPMGNGTGLFDFVKIVLSTSTKPLLQFDPDFEPNHGPDRTTVYSSGPIAISASKDTTGGPTPFTVAFNFQNPYLFDGSTGNLVVDISSRGSRVTDCLHLDFATDMSVITLSSAFATEEPFVEFGVPVTQFMYVPVPEPRSFLLTSAGAAVLIILGHIRRFR